MWPLSSRGGGEFLRLPIVRLDDQRQAKRRLEILSKTECFMIDFFYLGRTKLFVQILGKPQKKVFLVARPLRGRGVKDLATKKKEPILKLEKKIQKKTGH